MSDSSGALDARTLVVHPRRTESRVDRVAIEEPLEIRVIAEIDGRRERTSLAVTMRTPGRDLDLAAGFLLSEGVVRRRADLWRVEHCQDGSAAEPDNVVDAFLHPDVSFSPARFTRHVYTSSSCGVCGKASLDQVRRFAAERPAAGPRIDAEVLYTLPERLRRAQAVFATTGGLHAAGLFDASGELQRICEDVGRHNAVDKLVGALLRDDELPLRQGVLLVSGRASFELVQKAVMAGIPVLAAVGAPSSLAISLAREFGVTLIGFLREERFNVYGGEERVGTP